MRCHRCKRRLHKSTSQGTRCEGHYVFGEAAFCVRCWENHRERCKAIARELEALCEQNSDEGVCA